MSRSGSRWRPGTVIVAALLLVAVICVITGLLPAGDASALGRRVVPVLGFVVAVTIVAELARDAAVFDVVARLLGRWGRGRVVILWGLVVLLAVLSTVFLSLDTTAVIVTPVVVLLARGAGLPPLPFALVTIWLANTASLLLPVSNLTNLLAAARSGLSPQSFLALTWAPALAGVVIPVAILTLRYRRVLLRAYALPPRVAVSDPWLFRIAAAVVMLLLPLLAVSTEVWIPATVAAVALIVLFAVRRRHVLRLSLVPWRALGLAAGLFVIVETAHARGLAGLLAPLTADGHGLGEILTVAATGALGANGINNLPAYLVLEPTTAGDPILLVALLIGVNLGPLITPWASLATLLWHDRMTSLGVQVRWRSFIAWGLVAAVPAVAGAAILLFLTTR